MGGYYLDGRKIALEVHYKQPNEDLNKIKIWLDPPDYYKIDFFPYKKKGESKENNLFVSRKDITVLKTPLRKLELRVLGGMEIDQGFKAMMQLAENGRKKARSIFRDNNFYKIDEEDRVMIRLKGYCENLKKYNLLIQTPSIYDINQQK